MSSKEGSTAGTRTVRHVGPGASDSLFRGQLEASVDGVLCIGTDGRVLYHNARFVELWGLPKDGFMGASDEALTRALTEKLLDPDGYLAKVQTLHDHPEQISRDEVHLSDGRVFDHYSAPVADHARGTLGRVWFFRDISQRKRTEEELRAANERLRELNAMKNQFVNTAAHELATPLTPIELQVHLLQAGQLGELNDRQRAALDLIGRNMNRLNVLMRDVLDAADVQSDRITLRSEPLAVDALVRGTLDTYKGAADAARIHVESRLQPDLWVRGDPNRLQQVLRSVLDNALKFTPAGGRVVVHAKRDAENVVVHVQDSGIGLRPDDFRKIFQPFSQVHDTMQRTQSGRGLGLVIAQGIVELHGGRMWCDSPGPGRGATFSFSIPYSAKDVPKVEATTPDKLGQRSRVWPFIHFRCPVCESRDINMRIIKNKYECMACKHTWR